MAQGFSLHHAGSYDDHQRLRLSREAGGFDGMGPFNPPYPTQHHQVFGSHDLVEMAREPDELQPVESTAAQLQYSRGMVDTNTIRTREREEMPYVEPTAAQQQYRPGIRDLNGRRM